MDGGTGRSIAASFIAEFCDRREFHAGRLVWGRFDRIKLPVGSLCIFGQAPPIRWFLMAGNRRKLRRTVA
jgi:hypothetical protein